MSPQCRSSIWPENPGVPPPGFSFSRGPVRPRRPRGACRWSGRRADRPPRGPRAVGKLFLVELRGHMRLPFAGHRPGSPRRVKLAAIDPHRATEAAADLECRLDDGVACQARRDRLEIGDFAGRRRRVIRSSSFGQGAAGDPLFYAAKRPGMHGSSLPGRTSLQIFPCGLTVATVSAAAGATAEITAAVPPAGNQSFQMVFDPSGASLAEKAVNR